MSKTYINIQVQFREYTDMIKIQRGVRQADMSLRLFTLNIPGKHLYLIFADDIVIIAKSKKELTSRLKYIHRAKGWP